MNWWQAFGNPNDYLEVRWAALFFVAALLWAGGAGLRRPLSYMGCTALAAELRATRRLLWSRTPSPYS
jgi:hypothetical protein